MRIIWTLHCWLCMWLGVVVRTDSSQSYVWQLTSSLPSSQSTEPSQRHKERMHFFLFAHWNCFPCAYIQTCMSLVLTSSARANRKAAPECSDAFAEVQELFYLHHTLTSSACTALTTRIYCMYRYLLIHIQRRTSGALHNPSPVCIGMRGNLRIWLARSDLL